MKRKSATYKEIQNWVRQNHGFLPKTCWIAHCKELYGLPVSNAPNRQSDILTRQRPSFSLTIVPTCLTSTTRSCKAGQKVSFGIKLKVFIPNAAYGRASYRGNSWRFGKSVPKVSQRGEMVPAEGIEPPTFGLQNHCSTAELSRQLEKSLNLIIALLGPRAKIVSP